MRGLDIESKIIQLAEEVDAEIATQCQIYETLSMHNHLKVLQAFNKAKVSDYHLKPGSGYGYDCLLYTSKPGTC